MLRDTKINRTQERDKERCTESVRRKHGHKKTSQQPAYSLRLVVGFCDFKICEREKEREREKETHDTHNYHTNTLCIAFKTKGALVWVNYIILHSCVCKT